MASNTRLERVVLETKRYRIIGQVTLPAEGYRGRLTDLLNDEGHSFIALTEAQLIDLEGVEEPEFRHFVAVGRDQVEIAFEDSEFSSP